MATRQFCIKFNEKIKKENFITAKEENQQQEISSTI